MSVAEDRIANSARPAAATPTAASPAPAADTVRPPPTVRGRKARFRAPCGAIFRSTISRPRRDAGCRRCSTASSPAAPRPMPRCATTARPSTNTASCRACSTTFRAATRPRPCSARPMRRRSAFRRMGSAALCAYRGDIVLTRAAAAMNVPMILSAASLIRLEDVRRENPNAWYQAYLAGRRRAHRAAGRSRRGGRLRHLRGHRRRAGAAQPREQRPQRLLRCRSRSRRRSRWDTASRIRAGCSAPCCARCMNHGMPHFENMDADARPAGALAQPDAQHRPARPARLEACRADPPPLEGQARGQGHPRAAGRAHRARERRRRRHGLQPRRPPARRHGVARCARCRRSPPTPNGMTVMLDGGIRRGTDVLKALALGAQVRLRSAGRCSMPRSPAARPACGARSTLLQGGDRPRHGAARRPQHRRGHAGAGAADRGRVAALLFS